MTYYRKQGRRYVECDYGDFPPSYATGVWLVTEDYGVRHKRRIMHLGDTPTVMTYAAFARHADAIATAIAKVQDWTSRSPHDMAEAVIEAVARQEDMRRVPGTENEWQEKSCPVCLLQALRHLPRRLTPPASR